MLNFNERGVGAALNSRNVSAANCALAIVRAALKMLAHQACKTSELQDTIRQIKDLIGVVEGIVDSRSCDRLGKLIG